MENAFKLLLVPVLFPLVSVSQTVIAYDYQTVFDFVEDEMPEAFDVGQQVFFQFAVDFSAPALLDGETLTYRDAVSTFSMNVPEAGFSFGLPTGDLWLDAGTNEVSISLFGIGQSFQDQELISLELVLSRVDGGFAFNELSDSTNFFDEAAVSRWSVSFANATGTSATNGAVSIGVDWTVGIVIGSAWTIVPEPNAYALILGLIVVTFGATARRRRDSVEHLV